MKFNNTTAYALRTLTQMARDHKKIYSALELHKLLKIPKKYLEKVLTDLTKAKLVKSIRGRSGGFLLSKPPEKIFLSEIINIIEGYNGDPVCFFGLEKCALVSPCAMHDKWVELQNSKFRILSETSLNKLVKNI